MLFACEKRISVYLMRASGGREGSGPRLLHFPISLAEGCNASDTSISAIS